MFRLLGAAVAALVLSFAGSANAAYQMTWTGTGGADVIASGFEAGTTYYALLEGDADWTPQDWFALYRVDRYINDVYAIGFNREVLVSPVSTSAGLFATFSFPVNEPPNADGLRTDYGPFKFRVISPAGGDLPWRVTISDVAPSAVPEPATWAMLIMGFGLAGAGLRARRRSYVTFQ